MRAVGGEAQGAVGCGAVGLAVYVHLHGAAVYGDELLRALRVRLGFQAGAGVYLDIKYLKRPPVPRCEQRIVPIAPLVLQQRRDGAYVKLLRALLLS